MFCSGNRCLELVLIAVHIRYTHTHRNPKLQKLEYLESWKCIIKCMQGRWTVDAAYVPYVVFIWKRLCGTLRTCAICPGCSLWYPGQSYAFTDQYNEEIMGRHGQYVWRMQESDMTVIRCRGRGWTVGQPMLGLFFYLLQLVLNKFLCLADMLVRGHVLSVLLISHAQLSTYLRLSLCTPKCTYEMKSKIIQKLDIWEGILGHSWCKVRKIFLMFQ